MIYLLHDLIHNPIKPFRWNAILYFITLLTKKQKIKMAREHRKINENQEYVLMSER